jgi:hypothetical protein
MNPLANYKLSFRRQRERPGRSAGLEVQTHANDTAGALGTPEHRPPGPALPVGIEIDNSAAERALRAAAIHNLPGTARLSGVDPEHWLREALARIADHPLSRFEELLPWNMAADLQPVPGLS